MAASELSNRLDYLISYSSQLVFVCTDKVKQQSQVVESFLAQQNEQAELALLTANPLTPLASYRESIFRQLFSQEKKADFNRPLNQLLAPLNIQHGAILISIFQADKLPNTLVKEIWELVLQSRFANNKQHLNVLLMGESSWAEKMKTGLASRSKDKPILLNSHFEAPTTQSFTAQDNYHSLENTDLETLIQDKRQKFAERVKARKQQTYADDPILKKWWMMGLLSMVFLMIFAGILGWQYSDQVVEWMAVNSHNKPEQLNHPTTDTDAPNLVIDETPVQAESEQLKQTPIEINSSHKLIEAEINQNNQNLLVTDWQTAVVQVDEKVQELKLENASNEIESQTLKAKEPTSSAEEPIALIDMTSTQVQTGNKNTAIDKPLASVVNDYPVEDIVAYEQNEISQRAPVSNALFILPFTSIDDLTSLPITSYVIQVAAMSNLNILQDYIRDENLSAELWLYKTQRYSADWYVLIKNQHFPSIEAARAYIQTLPNSILRNTPFVKSVRQIQQEISLQSR